jgi:predicted transcriptional regulator YdeE
MEPKIARKEAFSIVGMHYRGNNAEGEIPQIWRKVGPRMSEIKNIVEHGAAYGVSDNMDQATGEFDYIAGFAVSDVKEVPEGMVNWQIPGGQYAVFRTTLPKLGDTFKYAYYEWLPKSEYEHRPGPDLELYDEAFDATDPNSEFEVYVPIQ